MYAQREEANALFDIQLLKYIFFSGLTLILYQYLLTCDYSVKYLWKRPSKMTFCHWAFLANRYVPFLAVLILAPPLFLPINHFKSCAVLIIMTQFSLSANIFMSALILTIRLCVVWKDTRIVVVLAYLNFGILCIFSLATFVMSYIRNKRYAYSQPVSLINCIGVESLNWASLPLFVASESVSILLLGYRRYRDTRMDSNLLRYALYRTLVDDGLLYYSYSIILALVDSVLFFYLKNRILVLGIAALDTALHSITTMYICIRLRCVDDRERMKMESITSNSEEIQFADGTSYDSDAA
ncbi:hypothetical protein PNOK_0655300 [Pyrrhoderma noxium]|uniref:DUF6533 domain-containing protein n=1 Tax=Pyrrhoderma noxium TaxID=2282107 RepID=A0A286UER2_9AGAM|nr:hypothetical protein PNOK_0655300 [Pyrrhoderma noxium]